MNLLLVEDETRVADFVQRGLRSEGWTVTLAQSGEDAMELLADDDFDVIVLDLMLPGISGQDVCRRLRAKRDVTPIIMLTAMGDVEDRVRGLKLGADDYLAKPFDFDELVARVEALARRATNGVGEPKAHVLTVGRLSYDTRSLEVRVDGQVIALSAKEREILHMLMADPGRVYSRERILNALWGVNEDPLTNVVDVYVSRLRKKLGPGGGMIATVRGAGYRMASD